MKPDLYTKSILTVIALILLLIACNQYINPEAKASAEGPFAGMQFSGNGLSFDLFDPRTGDVWSYYSAPAQTPPPATPGKITVVDGNQKPHYFDTEEQAQHFENLVKANGRDLRKI